MARFNKMQVLEAIGKTGMVPVFYHADADVAEQVVKACYEGGVRAFEFTNRGDFASEVFIRLVKFAAAECPEMILGIGSVVDAPTAAMYLVHQNADVEKLGQVPAQLFGTDAVEHIVDDLVVVWPVIGSDFAGNKKLALFQQTLDCHTGVLVMLKNVGHNSICDLVTDLIGMTIADLFTSDDLTHVLSSLSCITKQAAFALAHK